MNLRLLFWLFLIATLGYGQWMQRAVRPLTSDRIVAYELARTAKSAENLLYQFEITSRIEPLRHHFYLDFGYLLLYGLGLFIGIRFALSLASGAGLPARWALIGGKLAWLGILAMGCDLIENLSLMQQLPPARPTDQLAGLAWAMASVKFGAVICALISMLAFFGYYGFRKTKA